MSDTAWRAKGLLFENCMAFSMWAAMMVAMMPPVVTPWLLVLSGTKREKDPGAAPFGKAAGVALAGYGLWMLVG